MHASVPHSCRVPPTPPRRPSAPRASTCAALVPQGALVLNMAQWVWGGLGVGTVLDLTTRQMRGALRRAALRCASPGSVLGTPAPPAMHASRRDCSACMPLWAPPPASTAGPSRHTGPRHSPAHAVTLNGQVISAGTFRSIPNGSLAFAIQAQATRQVTIVQSGVTVVVTQRFSGGAWQPWLSVTVTLTLPPPGLLGGQLGATLPSLTGK